MNIHFTNILLLIAAVAVVAACSTRRSDRPILMVSIDPQKYLLDQIVGDKMEVRSFLSSDANPENFDPSIASMAQLRQAKAYMRVGHLPFEEVVLDRIVESYPQLAVYDTSSGIATINDSHHCDSHSHNHTAADPHTWSSVKNAIVMVQNMKRALKAIDPANANFYASRADSLILQLQDLDKQFSQQLLPLRGHSFIMWHPSLSYFAKDYGLNQIAIGVDNKEMSVGIVRDKLRQIAGDSAKIMFITPEFDGRKADPLMHDLDIATVQISPLAYDWESEMKHIVSALTSSL